MLTHGSLKRSEMDALTAVLEVCFMSGLVSDDSLIKTIHLFVGPPRNNSLISLDFFNQTAERVSKKLTALCMRVQAGLFKVKISFREKRTENFQLFIEFSCGTKKKNSRSYFDNFLSEDSSHDSTNWRHLREAVAEESHRQRSHAWVCWRSIWNLCLHDRMFVFRGFSE